jgi:hypothetical protein
MIMRQKNFTVIMRERIIEAILMRIESWNPNVMDETFENVAIDRLVEGAEVVAKQARRNCPVGTVTRPIYKSGPYAGQNWTARDGGKLKKSVRVTQKLSKSGKPLNRKRNVRVYAGNYLAYYAKIVEFSGKAFLRNALNSSIGEIKSIIGAK